MNEKSFRSAEYEWRKSRRPTERDKFFDTLNALMPWDEWLRQISPHWLKGGRGAEELNTLLRVYIIQRCFNVPDEDLSDVVYDSDSMMSFACIDLDEGEPPQDDAMRDFRRALDELHMGDKIMEEMRSLLRESGKTIRFGKIGSLPHLTRKEPKE